MSPSHRFLVLLSALFLPTLTATVFRNVYGPSGKISDIDRLRDTVGTSLRLLGPIARSSIHYALRSGPLSGVFRNAITSPNTSIPCTYADGNKCVIAKNGFGTFGEVSYVSTMPNDHLQALSNQVITACRCLAEECNKAVLIRPVNVLDNNKNIIRRTCLYERVNNMFSDCYGELLRVNVVKEDVDPWIYETREENKKAWDYSATTQRSNWTAHGFRGWEIDCTEEEVENLSLVTFNDIKQNIGVHYHTTPPDNRCTAPEGVEYVVMDDQNDGELCAKLSDFAISAAGHRGTAQDDIATGLDEDSFAFQRPALITNTEFALAGSAAGLGIAIMWGMHRRNHKKNWTLKQFFLYGILGQVLMYILESLPMYTALGMEIQAARWQSIYGFLDAALAVSNDTDARNGDATGSVLGLAAVVGNVRYAKTRSLFLSVSLALFTILAFGIISKTLSNRHYAEMVAPCLAGCKKEKEHKEEVTDDTGTSSDCLFQRLSKEKYEIGKTEDMESSDGRSLSVISEDVTN